MINFKESIAELVSSQVENLTREEVLELIEVPPDFKMGDYAMPCFKMAKAFRKAPNVIAEEIAKMVGTNENFEKVENAGPYVNFFVNKVKLAESVLVEIEAKKEMYGSSDLGKGKNVIVEFSSPNIAKPFHIGHIRTTVIGNSLYKIYKYLGFNTIAINHLGDYGTQFGKMIVAYKKWGEKEVIENNPIPELLKLYVKFHDVAKENPELNDEARLWFKKLEQNDPEAKELWQWFIDESMKEFNKVYDTMNVHFDYFTGESFYSDKMQAIIDELEEKNLLVESQGATIVDLEPYGMPPSLVKKSDGSTLYTTRDIAAAKYRKDNYDFYKNIYVVGSEQKLHFEQWIKVVELMGYEWAKDCIHVPFGMVNLAGGSLSTREGNVVFLQDVLTKAVEKTEEIIEAKNPNLENKALVAKQVGIGAILFQELFNGRIKDYEFNWDRALSFEGETGPYVQYTHTRANSVLKKANAVVTTDIDFTKLTDETSVNVIRLMEGFPQVIIDAMEKNEPSIITRRIVEIAQAFNRFYQECPILIGDEETKAARLLLVYSVKQVLKNGLLLLGIEVPDKM